MPYLIHGRWYQNADDGNFDGKLTPDHLKSLIPSGAVKIRLHPYTWYWMNLMQRLPFGLPTSGSNYNVGFIGDVPIELDASIDLAPPFDDNRSAHVFVDFLDESSRSIGTFPKYTPDDREEYSHLW